MAIIKRKIPLPPLSKSTEKEVELQSKLDSANEALNKKDSDTKSTEG